MEFLSEDDILVLEKDQGTIRRIVNGTLLPEPLLDVSVATQGERGMLGIAAAARDSQSTSVFIYFTESPTVDGSDADGVEPLGNRLYKYELHDGQIVNGRLLLDLPAVSAFHNGGKIKIGHDDNLYIVIGDQQDPGQVPQVHRTTAQNVPNSIYPDGTGGILRMTQDGKAVENVLGGNHPVDLYYAYGIRNSFGIAFDPVTNNLWDTENGPESYDEINLVEPGFNGGWRLVQGFADSDEEIAELIEFPGLTANERALYGLMEQAYFKFHGLGGKYSDPEFVWANTVAPTGLVFLDSDKFGNEYENDLFVGSYKYGFIYNFNLNEERTSFELSGPLEDKVENNPGASDDIIIGRNFGQIVDLEVGPDGYLYVLSIDGKLHRILSVNDAATVIPELSLNGIMVHLFMSIMLAAVMAYLWFIRRVLPSRQVLPECIIHSTGCRLY